MNEEVVHSKILRNTNIDQTRNLRRCCDKIRYKIAMVYHRDNPS